MLLGHDPITDLRQMLPTITRGLTGNSDLDRWMKLNIHYNLKRLVYRAKAL